MKDATTSLQAEVNFLRRSAFSENPSLDKICAAIFGTTVVVSLGLGLIIISSANVFVQPDGSLLFANTELENEFVSCGGNPLLAGLQGRDVFSLFSDFVVVPVVTILGIPVIAFLWLMALQKFTRIVSWLSIALKVALWIFLGVYMIILGSVPSGAILLAVGVIFAIFFFLMRDDVEKGIGHLNMGTRALTMPGNRSVYAVSGLVEVLYILYLVFFWLVSIKSSQVFELNEFVCQVTIPTWVSQINNFMLFAMLWVSFFFRAVILNITAVTIGSWYFKQSDRPSTSALAGLKFSFTGGFGVLSIASLVLAIVDRIRRYVDSKTGYFHPLGLIAKLIGCCIYSILHTYSKFLVIAHAFGGKDFYSSAQQAVGTMKGRFKGGLINDWLVEIVVRLGAFVFSAGITFGVWKWFDTALGVDTLGQLPPFLGFEAFTGIVLGILYLIQSPLLCILALVLVAPMVSFMGQVIQPVFCSVFVGSVSFIIFSFFGDLIVNSTNTIFFAYAVAESNGVSVDGTDQAEMKKLIQESDDVKMAIPVDVVA